MATENNLEACAVEKLATILAIGTTNPPNCFYQVDYPDFYFRVTKSEHMTQLKDKFQRICEKSAIKKHYMHLNEAMLKENPCLTIYKAPSSDVHQDILVKEVPKLGMEAALKAIKEWGQPFSKITYLIFCTSSGIDMPSADHKLAKLIGLKPSIQRFMIYNQGCLAGATALRLAKDLVENNVKLGLNKERLRASRHVLSEYGNMWGPSVIFVLNEMRKMSVIEGKATTGEGLEWGVLFGIGPGLTVETLVLRNFATNSAP
ncbi:hypothetical protein GOBAR_AA15712 [Gossypium barbadense]|uniref:Chalcone/stilbene synthase N-terminal domain-containing protein n=1 Tax=Gossypium barbadense TaxID=3634 RepID=A0A2P5XNM3_GOSBA|nr:hypothetical protein GOBAR_AA15712 [Gossypium barbadense]